MEDLMKILVCLSAILFIFGNSAMAEQKVAKKVTSVASASSHRDACLLDTGDPQFPTEVKDSCCKNTGGTINDNSDGHPPIALCEGGKYDGYYVGSEAEAEAGCRLLVDWNYFESLSKAGEQSVRKALSQKGYDVIWSKDFMSNGYESRLGAAHGNVFPNDTKKNSKIASAMLLSFNGNEESAKKFADNKPDFILARALNAGNANDDGSVDVHLSFRRFYDSCQQSKFTGGNRVDCESQELRISPKAGHMKEAKNKEILRTNAGAALRFVKNLATRSAAKAEAVETKTLTTFGARLVEQPNGTVYLKEVPPGSNAEKAGFASGDKLVKATMTNKLCGPAYTDRAIDRLSRAVSAVAGPSCQRVVEVETEKGVHKILKLNVGSDRRNEVEPMENSGVSGAE
jgi:hypothetical protein